MPDSSGSPLGPQEVLRVMDAVQVIRARQAELDRHEAFDRDATVREIQVMFEGLGDLVDEEVIGAALDEYLSERYAFVPPPRGLRTTLARLYIERGVVARRVLMPAAVVAFLGWVAFTAVGSAQRAALERDVRALRADIASLVSDHGGHVSALAELRAAPPAADLPEREAASLTQELASAERFLAAAGALIEGGLTPDVVPDEPSAELRRAIGEDAEALDRALLGAAQRLEAAGSRLRNQERLVSLREEAAALAASIAGVAEEAAARSLATELAQAAESHHGTRNVDGLEAATARLRELLNVLEQEYELVVTGGVWRRHDDDPRIRNDYLIVQAVGRGGGPVRVRIRNEENGRTEVVSQWAERVPRDVYDRVARDKADNQIIDDDGFGVKRRGYRTLERRYPDVGQITRW